MRRSQKFAPEGNKNIEVVKKNSQTHTHTLVTEYIFILFYLFIADNPIKSKNNTKQHYTQRHTRSDED